ncbi:unnamed protein product [Symbiodinium sp. CCMP2456]|nr:unnamed protein product [Symbiodinium sp. CCMP2456]
MSLVLQRTGLSAVKRLKCPTAELCHRQESMPFLGELAPRWTAPVQDSPLQDFGIAVPFIPSQRSSNLSFPSHRPGKDQVSELRAKAAFSPLVLALSFSPCLLAWAKVDEQVDLRVAAGAAPFNHLCRVYVNVVALALYMPPSPAQRWKDLRGAIELAYKDVATAFVQFVEDPGNAGRPFFLAGHSQGTMHLMRLVQEEVEPYPDRRDRFVHGYLAGQTVPLRMFQTLRHVRPSIRATDICSVSSWRTAAPQHMVLVHCGMIFHRNAGWLPLTGKILATNPVTWEAGAGNRASHPQEYLGAAFPLPENLDPRESQGLASGVVLRFGSLVASKTSILGARLKALSPVDCGEVTVVVDGHSVTRVPKLPSTSLFAVAEHDWLMYHDVDIALFHGNLQANAEHRHQAWQMRGRSRM